MFRQLSAVRILSAAILTNISLDFLIFVRYFKLHMPPDRLEVKKNLAAIVTSVCFSTFHWLNTMDLIYVLSDENLRVGLAFESTEIALIRVPLKHDNKFIEN